MRRPDRGRHTTDPVLDDPTLQRLEVGAAGRDVPPRYPLDDQLAHELLESKALERLFDPAPGVRVQARDSAERYGDGDIPAAGPTACGDQDERRHGRRLARARLLQRLALEASSRLDRMPW